MVVVNAALVLIVTRRLAADVVALLVLLALVLGGVVSTRDALAGFSSPVVLTLIGLFIITRALEETGVIQFLALQLNRLGGGSEGRMVGVFMTAGALLSLVMNNVAAGAVLLPAAVRVAQLSKVRLSKLLIPMAFGTLVGGMATYLTTANIVMDGLLQTQGLPGIGFVDFAVTGGPIVVAGVVFMLVVGRGWLPDRQSIIQRVTQSDLRSTYQLEDRMWEVRVLPESRLVGMTLGESAIGREFGVTVLAIWHGHRAIFSPGPEAVMAAEDYLLVLGREERVAGLIDWGTAFRKKEELEHDYSVALTEVIIPPRSAAIGQTLTSLRHRNKYGLTAVALWRGGRSYRTDVGKFVLQVGDALLMVGPREAVKRLAAEKDYLVLGNGADEAIELPQRAWRAVVITAAVIALSVLGTLPLPIVMLGGAAALMVTGCVNTEAVYRAVEWRVIFLIAGMLPISVGVIGTGLGGVLGRGITAALADFGPLALIAGMFLLTMVVTQVIGGQIAALIVGPIALSAALAEGVSPQAMAVTVSIACSAAFLTPLAHPVNLLMMGPGGYRFEDFFKVGLGMTVVTLATLLVMMVVVWGI